MILTASHLQRPVTQHDGADGPQANSESGPRAIGWARLARLPPGGKGAGGRRELLQLEQAVCNAHCFVRFRAVKTQFPAEYAVAAQVYEKVFDNDAKAKARGLDHDERMLYHREHSKPQMLRLWEMCKDKIDHKLVEPNSPLWEPVSFVINQWPSPALYP